METHQTVHLRGTKFGRINPKAHEMIVISANAIVPAIKIDNRECRIAKMAAIKKVLSPSSLAIIITKAVTKLGQKRSVFGTSSIGGGFGGFIGSVAL